MEPSALNALLPVQPPALPVSPSGAPYASATSVNATVYATEDGGLDGNADAQIVAAARAFMLGAVLLMGSVCCALALTTCYRRRRELKSTASAFVVNLCVGDLLLCLLIAPALATDVLARWRPATSGELSARWCQIEGALAATLFVASSFNACAVSIDRYVAVRQSLRYASWFSRGTCNGIIASSWLAAVCIGAAPLLGRSLPPPPRGDGSDGSSSGGARDFCDCVRSPLVGASRHENVAYAACLAGAAFLVPLAVHAYVYLSIYQATKSTTALARRNSVQTPPQRGSCPSCEGGGPQQLQQQRCACSSGGAQSSQHRNQRHRHLHHQLLTGSRHHDRAGHPAALVTSPTQQQQQATATDCASADAACAVAECSGGGGGGSSRKCSAGQTPRRPSWQMRLVHKDDRKAAKMGVMVVFSFVATWAPLYCLRLAEAMSAGGVGEPAATSRYGWLAVVLAFCDCVANPLVYVLRSKRSLELLKCNKTAPTFGRRIPIGGPKCFSISRAPNHSSKRLIEGSDEYSGAEIYA